eukprot:CAMPEP_0197253774 /NCGR_PEP_ID=MMETSP1429-20130617/66264_1 /TAXON_ID=49237 /ORGANISM="Chaetoceros  sp., Strain UNC1202" /LENGTH=138 /DNA_ID=CAMNT_0042716565 /DNA_START=93 /DNA_END=506 /DNA_ORIENTATION=+
MTRSLLVGIGQSTHSITTRMTIWSAGYKVRKIQPLEKEAALSQGADFIGESFIFGVGSGLVVWEYNRSKLKDAKKEAKLKDEGRARDEKLDFLNQRLEALQDVVRSQGGQIELLSLKDKVDNEETRSMTNGAKKRKGW